MKPGPKPLPSNVHLLNGNPSKKSNAQLAHELKPDVFLPDPPDHLDDRAKEEWRAVGPELVRLGLISRIDATGFAIACSLYAKVQVADEKLRELGPDKWIITTPSGYQQESVWLQIFKSCTEKLRPYLSEYARTPSARTGFRLLSPQLDLFPNATQQPGAEAPANPAARHFPAG